MICYWERLKEDKKLQRLSSIYISKGSVSNGKTKDVCATDITYSVIPDQDFHTKPWYVAWFSLASNRY